MDYMSSVVSETQRMYTVVSGKRECQEDYEWNGIVIPKKIEVDISFDTMTHDEKYYPEPEKFIPERERPVDCFMPFGSGPRSCVAMRFALFEIKLALANILSKYRFEKCSKTNVSICLAMITLCYYSFLELYF